MDPPPARHEQPAAAAEQEAAREAAREGAAAAVFRKKGNRGNIRKRDTEDDLGDEVGGTAVKKQDTKKDTGLAFKTEKAGKIEAVQFAASREIKKDDGGVFRTLETETAFDRDARAQRERVLKQAGEIGKGPEKDDKLYRGQNGYIDYKKGFRSEHNVGSEKGTGSHGPLRANVTIRTTIRMDYQPDICKDYKETGYCGWGDTCKFLHDRGDYKAGWQIDRDYEDQQKKRREAIAAGWNPDEEEDKDAAESEEDDDLPFACGICREAWEENCDPVKTKCGHYFHEHCALKHHSKNGKCSLCDKPTGGIFNAAKEINLKIKRRKEKEERKAGGLGED